MKYPIFFSRHTCTREPRIIDIFDGFNGFLSSDEELTWKICLKRFSIELETWIKLLLSMAHVQKWHSRDEKVLLLKLSLSMHFQLEWINCNSFETHWAIISWHYCNRNQEKNLMQSATYKATNVWENEPTLTEQKYVFLTPFVLIFSVKHSIFKFSFKRKKTKDAMKWQ